MLFVHFKRSLGWTLILFTLVHQTIAKSDDIFKKFMEADPIYPTIRIPDVVKPEVPDIKVENVLHTSRFNPLEECWENRTELEVGDYGVIESPNYPRNYPSGQVCQWMLEGVPGTVIEASVYDMHTQPWFFTYFDYVQFSENGNFTEAKRMAGDLNIRTPFTIRSSENQLGIRFRSSSLFNYRGFKIQYLVKSAEENAPNSIRKTAFDGVCGQSQILFEEDEFQEPPAIPGVVPDTPIFVPGDKDSSTKAPQYWPSNIKASQINLGSLTENQMTDDLQNTRIVGPGAAPERAFPWQAALLVDGRGFCGGSLIDNYHVLTAAHCTDNANEIVVALGTINLREPTPGRKVYRVTREGIFQHPQYNPFSIDHDISIIRLPEKVVYSENIQPICLPNRYYNGNFFQGRVVKVSGFGKPSDDASSVSPFLKNATIAVMSNRQCRTVFRGVVTGNQICTATKTTVSPCKGDSGGPLIVKETTPSGHPFYMQVGIVSFGGESCERAMPVGFTRTTAFLDYISTVTGRPI